MAVSVDAASVDRGTLTELLRAASDGVAPAGVLSLLALDERARPDESAVTAGLAATFLLAQALGDLGIGAPLWCATQGAVSIGASDRLRAPDQSAVWGLGRVIGLEHPRRWGGLVDLPAVLDAAAVRRVAEVIGSGDGSDEDQLAVRTSGVFVRRLVHAPSTPTAGGANPDANQWSPTGTILITGGTGALGSLVARSLAKGGAQRLILVSRRGPDAPGAAGLLAEIEHLGAQAVAVACDISDRSAVAAMIRDVEAEAEADADADAKRIRAVVHAAGVPQSEPLDAMTPAGFAEVCAAKTAGARHLDELLGDRELDAFVTFSRSRRRGAAAARRPTRPATPLSTRSCRPAVRGVRRRRPSSGVPGPGSAWPPTRPPVTRCFDAASGR
jgi:hypothetical protein